MGKIDFDELFFRKETLLTCEDYADIECNDCVGCENSCCREISAQITLDSFDVALLKEGLGKSFDEMLDEGLIALKYINGAVVPIFANKEDRHECIFLRDDGRCSIHPWRAGICRMYPVARMWQENGKFAYYLQPGECVHRSTARTKISDWLGYEDIKAYEKSISEYHIRLLKYRSDFQQARTAEEREMIKESFFDENFRGK